jgi:PAS domain S-box-containing protein
MAYRAVPVPIATRLSVGLNTAIGVWCILTGLDGKSSIFGQLAALCTEDGLKTILDGIGEGFYAVDRDWRIVLFNNEAAQYFRLAPEQVIGRILWEIFPRARETGLGQLFLRTMQSREAIRSETESVIFKGHWLAYRLFPLGDGIGVVFRDITDRRSAEMQRDLLMKELEHRIKNTLTMVQSIADQTFRNSSVDPSVQQVFAARLISLGNAHALLTQRSWDSADLHEIITVAVDPHRTPQTQRFQIDGPILRLGPKAAVALSMAVHELSTNATKYGALTVEQGRVEITWLVDHDQFRWTWREQGGPLVAPPKQIGFGSRLIERMLAAQLYGQVKMDYQPTGLVCSIDAPLHTMCDI